MGVALELRGEGQAGICGERKNCVCKDPVVSVVTALWSRGQAGRVACSGRVKWGRAGAVGRGGRAPQAVLGL